MYANMCLLQRLVEQGVGQAASTLTLGRCWAKIGYPTRRATPQATGTCLSSEMGGERLHCVGVIQQERAHQHPPRGLSEASGPNSGHFCEEPSS